MLLDTTVGITEVLLNRIEIYGSFSIVLIIMAYAIYYLNKRNKEVELKYEAMSEKTIGILSLALKTMDNIDRDHRDYSSDIREIKNGGGCKFYKK